METQMDKILSDYFLKLKVGVENGPWVKAEQSSVFPLGCARFVSGEKRYSMNFLECSNLIEVLKTVNDSEDVAPIIKNFSENSSITKDPWRES